MKKVSVLLLGLFTAFSVSAQDAGFGSQPGRNTTFKDNGFWNNWFIGAGAGGFMYMGKNQNDADFQNRITVNPTFNVGTWFTPSIGMRLGVQGGKIHTFNEGATVMSSQLHGNAHLDLMWNMTNYFCKYNPNRFYHFIPTIGAGFQHRAGKNDKFFKDFFNNDGGDSYNDVTLNASILQTFRLGKRVDFFVEISGALVQNRFRKDFVAAESKQKWEGIVGVSGGFNFNLGKTDFEAIRPYDQAEIDRLTGKISSLQADNAELSKRPKFCPECPKQKPCPEVGPTKIDVDVPNVVFFKINSATIDRGQEISIYNTAQYLKSTPGAKVKIVGYADKDTGTAAYNMQLSQKRAQNVAKALIEKYNISSDRVAVEWKGSTVQPYPENAWNRVAIFFAE